MCSVRVVVFAHTCHIPADNEVSAPVILPYNGQEDCSFRAGIAHCNGQRREQYPITWVIILNQMSVTLEQRLGRKIISLKITYDRVDKKPVHKLECTPLDILMCNMRWISCLESCNGFPSSFLKFIPGLLRRQLTR